MPGPLSGLKVLDLSRVLAGPYCTQMLGDMGAEIIKIEKPGAGDDTRFWGPPFLKDTSGNDTSESAYYLSINRNKKSVAIDITKAEGQDLIHKLLKTTDILIENFKTGGLDKYGLSYADLKDQYPRLIYCSITGFGQNGPLATEPGYDLVAQAMGGLMGITGEVGGSPMKVGVAVSDILTGLHAGIGILAALHHREKTGQGQFVDVALLDCTLATMTNVAQYYLTAGKPSKRQGNAHATIVPYQAFEASDGWLVVAVGNDKQFERFATIIGHAEWAQDPKFKTNPARLAHREELISLIIPKIKSSKVVDLVQMFRDSDIPAGPVNSIDQIFAEDQIKARGMKISLPHALNPASHDFVGSPLKFSTTEVDYKSAPPFLGQDTVQVLGKNLGLSPGDIENLKSKKIIG